MTVKAIYEHGVFRPTTPVDLPENCEVEFEPRVVDPAVSKHLKELAKTDPGLAAIYAVLARRHNGGYPDTAERHNEHQP
jgi:predicted DNA-binding antitoxin AbrB/MazE fold protein